MAAVSSSRSSMAPSTRIQAGSDDLDNPQASVGGVVEYLLKRHAVPSTAASAASAPDNQNVIAISRYIAMAVASAARAYSA